MVIVVNKIIKNVFSAILLIQDVNNVYQKIIALNVKLVILYKLKKLLIK